jgi:hypothetical protein
MICHVCTGNSFADLFFIWRVRVRLPGKQSKDHLIDDILIVKPLQRVMALNPGPSKQNIYHLKRNFISANTKSWNLAYHQGLHHYSWKEPSDDQDEQQQRRLYNQPDETA